MTHTHMLHLMQVSLSFCPHYFLSILNSAWNLLLPFSNYIFGGGNFNSQGGAIFAEGNVKITISDTAFEQNTALNVSEGFEAVLKQFSGQKKPRDVSCMSRGLNWN